MSDWRETSSGNYVYPLYGSGLMTVFRRTGGCWAGVHDDCFTVDDYMTAAEAMQAMEAAVIDGVEGILGGESTGAVTFRPHGGGRKRAGGSSRHAGATYP